jgi:hypothetical protein
MDEGVRARSGGVEQAFELDWGTGRWHSTSTPPEGDFPFVAEIRGKRYELYSDGTFNEQDLSPEDTSTGP